jgi:hypothetical protein
VAFNSRVAASQARVFATTGHHFGDLMHRAKREQIGIGFGFHRLQHLLDMIAANYARVERGLASPGSSAHAR